MEQDQIYLAVANENLYHDEQLPDALKNFYAEFANADPGVYNNDFIAGIGFGVDNAQIGPVNITNDNTRLSDVDTTHFNPSAPYNVRLIVLQGYAQISIFDRF